MHQAIRVRACINQCFFYKTESQVMYCDYPGDRSMEDKYIIHNTMEDNIPPKCPLRSNTVTIHISLM